MLLYNLSLTLRYAFDFELDDSRVFSQNLEEIFREIQAENDESLISNPIIIYESKHKKTQ
nr:unnamed protein product [Callosobruchus chinensis]